MSGLHLHLANRMADNLLMCYFPGDLDIDYATNYCTCHHLEAG